MLMPAFTSAGSTSPFQPANFDAAVADGARAIRGAAPGKADERTFYVEQYDDHRHNRQQGTENDQNDHFFDLILGVQNASVVFIKQ